MERDFNAYMPFNEYNMPPNSGMDLNDPFLNPMMQYEQACSYYRYLCLQMDYKMKCKEYEKMCEKNTTTSSQERRERKIE